MIEWPWFGPSVWCPSWDSFWEASTDELERWITEVTEARAENGNPILAVADVED